MKELHHKESPSKYNAWVNCTHWDSMERETSEANAGTKAHAELERMLKDSSYDGDSFVARGAANWIMTNEEGVHSLRSELKLVGTMEGLEGISGTTDAFWFDDDGCPHFFDLKTFSDGSEDYLPQLKGYLALWITKDTIHKYGAVYLHIYHCGIGKVETIVYDPLDAYMETLTLLKAVRSGKGGRTINHYCQYCKHIKECPMANSAVQVVNGNGAVDFSKMSLPQKLVICETVEKLIKTLKEEAKQRAIENGGAIEEDGIRYEIKERSGKGKVRDLCELAGAMQSPYVKAKNGELVLASGLSQEDLLSLCELPKTAFVEAMKKANATMADIPKKNIEAWCASFYEKGEPTQYLSRVK